MYTLQDLYDGSFQVKLANARQLHRQFSAVLLAMAPVQQSLANLAFLLKQLQEQMAAFELYRCCTVCGARGSGGCCSLFMANENDVMQLFINLLAGCAVEVQEQGGRECLLLGAKGCVLYYKPIFCLNYNCRQIVDLVAVSGMAILERAAGKLLQEQFGLEQFLLARLRDFNALR